MLFAADIQCGGLKDRVFVSLLGPEPADDLWWLSVHGIRRPIISNYRGAKVSGIPERNIPDVLVRLARSASSVGKMPHQSQTPAPVCCQLAEILDQLDRQDEIRD
jgi:hypothetical protein